MHCACSWTCGIERSRAELHADRETTSRRIVESLQRFLKRLRLPWTTEIYGIKMEHGREYDRMTTQNSASWTFALRAVCHRLTILLGYFISSTRPPRQNGFRHLEKCWERSAELTIPKRWADHSDWMDHVGSSNVIETLSF